MVLIPFVYIIEAIQIDKEMQTWEYSSRLGKWLNLNPIDSHDYQLCQTYFKDQCVDGQPQNVKLNKNGEIARDEFWVVTGIRQLLTPKISNVSRKTKRTEIDEA